ncbi:MAG: hypothetical protein ABW096_20890 [Candidatus Thiodiazotropha sp.]
MKKRYLIIIVLLLVIFTWPYYVGRWIFNAKCEYISGVDIDTIIDARNEGVYDHSIYQQSEIFGVSSNKYRKNIEALGQGRIAFFEVNRSTSRWDNPKHVSARAAPDYERYFLADQGSSKCIPYSKEFNMRAIMMALAPGKCLASEKTDTIKSRYEIKTSGYHHTDSSAKTEVIDRHTNSTVAKFWSFRHVNPFNFVTGIDAVCPGYAERNMSPHKTMLSLLFLDKEGKTSTIDELREEEEKIIKRLVHGPDISNLEVHKVRVEMGIAPEGYKEKYKITNVVVSVKKPILLLLESDENVYWEVMVAPGADVAYIVTTGPPFHLKKYNNKLITVSNSIASIKNNQTLMKKIISEPDSIQEFYKTDLVIVDGKSRIQNTP